MTHQNNLYSDPSFPRPRSKAPRSQLPMSSRPADQPTEGRAGPGQLTLADIGRPQETTLPVPQPTREAMTLHLHSSINKWSLSGGAAASTAALLLLLDEPVENLIRHGQNTFTLDHGLTVGLLAVTTILGHLTVKSWQARRIGGSIAFPILFAFGTALTIYNSATRQSLVDERAQLEATFTNDQRAELETELKKMRKLRDETVEAAKTACRKSESTDNCVGKKATRDFYQRAVSTAESKLAQAPAPRLETTKAQQFAKLLKDLGITMPATVVAAILPFALALFFELTSIACYVNVRKETFK